MKYLKQFIIGSCGFLSLPQFWSLHKYNPKHWTDHHINSELEYYKFTINSPIRIGLWNTGSLIIAEHFGLSTRVRFMVTAILHWISTIIFVKYYDTYRMTDIEWMRYYIGLLLIYIIAWNIIIYNLEKVAVP